MLVVNDRSYAMNIFGRICFGEDRPQKISLACTCEVTVIDKKNHWELVDGIAGIKCITEIQGILVLWR